MSSFKLFALSVFTTFASLSFAYDNVCPSLEGEFFCYRGETLSGDKSLLSVSQSIEEGVNTYSFNSTGRLKMPKVYSHFKAIANGQVVTANAVEYKTQCHNNSVYVHSSVNPTEKVFKNYMRFIPNSSEYATELEITGNGTDGERRWFFCKKK